MEKDQLQHTEFNHIIGLISKAQNQAFKAVNKELVLLYWEIGSFVSGKVASGAWGEGVVVKLAGHIKSRYPNLKGFTKRGLYRMKQFYETYYQDEKVSPLLTQLSWSNHLMLMSKCKSIEEIMSVKYSGIWERIHNPDFNYGEFATIKSQAGLNSYRISVPKDKLTENAR